MASSVSAFAPGKLILTGEHAVVVGHEAVAMAISRGTTVRLVDRPGLSRVDDAPFEDRRLNNALRTLLPPNGVGVHITSNLPVGRGMGSSAALAIATVRALARREGREASFAECHEQGFVMERVFHGTPSGIDHSVSAMGGAIQYKRGQRLVPLRLPPMHWVVMDSGTAGNTAEMVEHVRQRGQAADVILNEIGTLTQEAIQAIGKEDLILLGSILTQNHRLLARLGVCTPTLDALVTTSLRAGAIGAKMAGAGGGGVAIALVTEPQPVIDAVAAMGLHAFSVTAHPPTPEPG